MATNIIPRTCGDELNEAADQLFRAQGLVEVLSELVCPCGDLSTGQMSIQQVGPRSLYSTLLIISDLLMKAHDAVQSAQTIKPQAVAHG